MTDKRTILITGCSDGSLGAALAKAFHDQGWRVFASARNPAKLKQSQALGIEAVALDVLSQESIEACAAHVAGLTGGSLDLLLNNAGAGYSMPVFDLELAKVRDLFELNVFTLVSVSRAFFPLLARSQHGGIIANNTSGSSLLVGGFPFAGAYNASKAAAASLTEALRLELEPFGIRVVNLLTGAVKSTFFDNVPAPHLPPDSMYAVAREAVEKQMSGVSAMSGAMEQEQYAANVARDLSRKHPPLQVWRGKYSTTARILRHLPLGTLDGWIKGQVGLDVLEQKVKEAKTKTD